jgi:hypothetical protein
MNLEASDELLFTVEGSSASSVKTVTIESLGLTERAHLQEWTIAHPEILGHGILIITFEFDRWSVTNGPSPRDRLDVLGLGRDGRLVLCELKRGKVPDTVEIQAIKYAAMASRFTEDDLADLHAEFLKKSNKEVLTSSESLEKLRAHTEASISPEQLLSPRIVLLAEEFSPSVTSSVVWLNEQGLDITLRRYKAYVTASKQTVVTVSQIYPVTDVAAFEVAPRLKRRNRAAIDELPVMPWSESDLALVLSKPFEVVHAILDLCSAVPGQWVGATTVYEKAGVDKGGGAGRLAGFGYSLRKSFGRSNPPWTTAWAVEDIREQNYKLDHGTADSWIAVRESSIAPSH